MRRQGVATIRTRIVAFFMSLTLLVLSLMEIPQQAFAGVATGSSSSISGTGMITNQAGGIYDMSNVVFRVAISRDPAFFHSTTADEKTTLGAFSHRFPSDRGDDGFFFIPKDYRPIGTNNAIGKYTSSTRTMGSWTDPASLSRLIQGKYIDGYKPFNAIKAALGNYSTTGKVKYSDLAGGKWKSFVPSTDKDDANRLWSFILYQTNGSYDVTKRMNDYISVDYGNMTLDKINKDPVKQEDVKRGYIGLLITTYRLVPSGMQSAWDNAIEDYLKNVKQTSTEQPTSIVVDTATTVVYSHGAAKPSDHKVIVPSLDYFEYYTAIRARRDLYQTSNLGTAAGDTHAMLKQIVDWTLVEEGKTVKRISDMYNENNVYSFGAAAAVYPKKRFSTSGGGGGHWDADNVKEAFMDSLKLGNTARGAIVGFNYVGYHLTMDIAPDPDPDGDIYVTAKEKDYKVESGRETIGVPVYLSLRHNPAAIAKVQAWKQIFDVTGTQPINVKINWTRRVTPSNTLPPSYSEGSVVGFKYPSGWFLQWLQGKYDIKVVDTSVVDEPIAAGPEKRFDYTPSIDITYKKIDGTMNTVTLNAKGDYASFKRQPKTVIDPVVYTSKPSAYAEVKQGTPNNESFDAMAGVPSNKRLYLGVGGSEFMVDAEFEYKQNVDSVWRTYKSIFTGVPSEFKAGDTAPNKTIGGQSTNMHNGGTYTKSWSGSIANTGSAASGTGTATSVAVPQWDDYNAKKAEAQAYVTEVNSTTHTHYAPSDHVTRSHTGWGASVTTDSKNPPQNVTQSKSHTEPFACGTTTCTKTVLDPVTASPSGPGSFNITVTFTVPAHIICGPEDTNDMPAVEDNWKQKINFDYMKISKLEVYKIDSGRVTRVDNVFGSGNSELKATIQQGDPNMFLNIAEKNAGGNFTAEQSSVMGRLRYSLDESQHDTVVYTEGPRSPKSDGRGRNGTSYAPQGGGHSHIWATGILYNNPVQTTEFDYHKNSMNGTNTDNAIRSDSKDQQTMEWKKFNERRTAMNTATVISDMLILQTSSGDQSVLYFAKDSTSKQAQAQFEPVRATKEEMWDNNPNSAAKWKLNTVNVGSYNGNYLKSGSGSSINQKYWGFRQDTNTFINNEGGGKNGVATRFDSNGVGVYGATSRPAKPGKLYMYGENAIVPTTPNGPYQTGPAETFYNRLVAYHTQHPYTEYGGAPLSPDFYSAQVQPNFGGKVGYVQSSPYSDSHSKVNDLVIHTPVSTQDAMVVSLPSNRDQRTTPPAGGAVDMINAPPAGGQQYEYVFNSKYALDVPLANIDFENVSGSKILNNTTGAYIPFTSSSGITIGPRSKLGFGSGNVLTADGTRWSLNFSDIGVTNTKETQLLVEMDFLMPTVPTNGGTMIVSFGGYDFYIPAGQGTGTWNTGNGWERRVDGVNFVGNKMHLGFEFGFGHILDCKLSVNGVEHKAYTIVNSSNAVDGLIGTQLNIGSWGNDNNYPAQFYIDNLSITKKGGTTTPKEWEYVTTVSKVNNTHVTSASDISDSVFADSGSTGSAGAPVNFGFTGSMQTFTAPQTGTYTLDTWGAQGGDAYGSAGGKGAYSTSTVTLNAGESLKILVGEKGGTGNTASNWSGSGGGGGTFIAKNDNTPLSVAGGGGGGAGNQVGGDAVASQNSPSGNLGTGYGGSGGLSGNGGGFYGNGSAAVQNWGAGGNSFINGGARQSTYMYTGSPFGGYGGGGSTHGNSGGGGGGGGYTGGAGTSQDNYRGNGGSSYFTGTDSTAVAGNSSMPSPSGSNETGHVGNGYARVTPKSTSVGGIGGYTWAEILGPNWKNYVTGGTVAGATGSRTFLNTGSGRFGGSTNNSSGTLTGNVSLSNGMYQWTVPATGSYSIETFGAQGGGGYGGRGARQKGDFNLTAGTVLTLLVGQAGINNIYNYDWIRSGGGGTFVVQGSNYADATPLVISGGGGGANNSPNYAVTDGSVTQNGKDGTYNGANYPGGPAGSVGNGAQSFYNSDYYYYYWGSLANGGAGFLSPAAGATYQYGDYARTNPPNGFRQGGSGGSGGAYTGYSTEGGFGGGGGAGYANAGGGGYTGGGAGSYSPNGDGGGGGSYNNGANQSSTEGAQTGHGKVVITSLQTSTPTVVNKDKIKADWASFPITMPDGAPNPLFGYDLIIGGASNVGPMKGKTGSGVDIVDVRHPTSGATVKAIRMNANYNGPIIQSDKLGLSKDEKYVLEFDYWASADNVPFNVDLFPDTLPEVHPTAMMVVKHYKGDIASLSPDMSNAILRIFNDLVRPTPADVYVTGLRLYKQPVLNAHVDKGDDVVTRTLVSTNPHYSGGYYDAPNPIDWDLVPVDSKPKTEVKLPTGGSVKLGTFINMDYGFQVYFPNLGDFAQQVDMLGINSITTIRGKGYTDAMDTTQYTAAKRVKFDYNVTYNGVLYTRGSWIDLPLNQSTYDFYCVLANKEAAAATIEYEAMPINGLPTGSPVNENYVATTNKARDTNYTALHGAYKKSYIDVVGRIGNFVVSDTEDFRFSNLFKMPSLSGDWLVQGLVKVVDSNKQNKYYGDLVDIRGEATDSTGKNLNTYGSQPWLLQPPLPFPINPKDNVKPALKEQFLKVGYDVLGDISTIGNYQEGVTRAIPYYFKLNLDTGGVTPLDAYAKNGEQYDPVNLYQGADGGALPANLKPYGLSMDWLKESQRRNYTMDESVITDRVAQNHGEYITGMVNTGGTTELGVTGTKRLSTPFGNFVDIGNAQRIVTEKRSRSFIGTSKTYGTDYNIGGQIDQDDWEYAAQRWHMKFGLPSSSVFVDAGKQATRANIDATQSGNAVILMTADIISIGELYTLRWDQPGTAAFTVTRNGKTQRFNLKDSGLPPVIAIYDLTQTAVIDVQVKGSH